VLINALLVAASGGGGGETRNPILPHTNELIYGVIAFSIFFAFFLKYAWPKANQALAARRALIEDKIEAAEADRAAAAALLADYKAKLADARGESARIIEEANRQAAAIVTEQTEAARQQAERIIQAAHDKAEADRAATVSELRRELGSLAVDLAEKIVRQSLESEARQSQVVEAFLADLESARA
jgi:F-type H+-transporting ATPase subunit b